MSNPALTRLLRGGLSDFHVGRDSAAAVAARGNPHPLFAGEVYAGRFSAKTEEKGYNSSHNFEKKENREEKGGKKDGKGEKRKKGDDSDDDSDDDGPHFKSDGIHAKGSDAGTLRSSPFCAFAGPDRPLFVADGDGKKNEGKNRKKPSFADKDKNGKVDAFEKK